MEMGVRYQIKRYCKRLNMKKILYISPADILERSGVSIACYSYYNALRVLYPGRVDLAMPDSYCIGENSNAIPIPGRRKIQILLSGCIHRYKSWLKRYLKNHHDEYSLCVLNVSVYAGDMMRMIKKYGIKTIVIHHNYEREYFMSNKTIETFKGRFPYFIVHNERNAYKQADLNLFLTQPDYETISSVYGRTKAVNYIIGVFDPEPIDYKVSKGDDKNLVAITGGFRAYQAYKSIEIFERDYFPLMKQNFPDLRLVLAGRAPAANVYEFQNKNSDRVELIPNPPDMDVIIDRASISLCPTCLGGGLKLHLMDGLRMGLPVLTHEVSARGYEQFAGNPCFQVYNSPESFVAGLNTIVEFVKKNSNYKVDVLETYKKQFSFEAGVNRMKEAIESVNWEI